MSKFNFRELSIEDSPDIARLCTSSTTVLKEEYNFGTSSLLSTFDGRTLKLFGGYIGGELVSIIGIKLWEQMPYFTLINMVYRKNKSLAVESAKNLNELLAFMLDLMHKDGRFTFYITTLTRAHQLKSFFKNNKVRHSKYFNALNAYDSYVEEIFEPNESSSYAVFRSFCGHKKHPRQIWTRRYSLAPASRKKYNGLYRK